MFLRYMKLLVVNHFNNKIGTFIWNIFSISILFFFVQPCSHFSTTTKPWSQKTKKTWNENWLNIIIIFLLTFSRSLTRFEGFLQQFLFCILGCNKPHFSNVCTPLFWVYYACSLCVYVFIFPNVKSL